MTASIQWKWNGKRDSDVPLSERNRSCRPGDLIGRLTVTNTGTRTLAGLVMRDRAGFAQFQRRPRGRYVNPCPLGDLRVRASVTVRGRIRPNREGEPRREGRTEIIVEET